MKRSSLRLRCLTLSAVFVALGVVILYVGALVEVLDLTLAALASFLVLFAAMEMGQGFPLMIYLCTALLSFLLLPSKVPAVLYALLLGFYPLIKFPVERLHPVLSWLLKLLFCNAALTAVIWIVAFVLGVPDSGFSFALPVYALANLTYILYDIAASRLITAYARVWRRRFRVDRFFGA